MPHKKVRKAPLFGAIALAVMLIMAALSSSVTGMLPEPNPPHNVTTVDGTAVTSPVSTSGGGEGAKGGPEATEDSEEYDEAPSTGGADAAPTTSYTIYIATAEAEADFAHWWHYESQIFTAESKPFGEVYGDGVVACSYRAMGYSAEQIWPFFQKTKKYAGTDAAAVVSAAFHALCPTNVELATTEYAVTGFKTKFDEQVDAAMWQLKYSPGITNQIGTPTLFDLGYFTKHVCHGLRLHGNTPAMLQYLVASDNGPHGSTYIPVLAAQKDGGVRYDGVLGELVRRTSHAAGCMSVIGG